LRAELTKNALLQTVSELTKNALLQTVFWRLSTGNCGKLGCFFSKLIIDLFFLLKDYLVLWHHIMANFDSFLGSVEKIILQNTSVDCYCDFSHFLDDRVTHSNYFDYFR